MPRLTEPSSVAGDNGPVTKQVIEYLSKKGYNRTEAMLRMESANQEASGTPARVEESGGARYARAFGLLKRWIEENLDVYKAELRRLLWPTFVYSFLNIVSDYYPKESRSFFTDFKASFEKEHGGELRALEPISLPEHVLDNSVAKIYRGAKYRLTMSTVAFVNLIQFLESKERDGGPVIIAVMQSYLNIVTIERNADDEHSLARMLGRARQVEDFPGEDEGIPGHNPGSANTDRNAGSTVLTRLKLGPLPMENDLMADVQAELEEEDLRNPPADGQNTLVQEFEQHIKREESEDAPNRQDVPLPPSLARDVAMEVQKVKENRDRFRIEGRTGGVGPAISVTMFTFHNTFDGINCLDFSQDNLLVAAGMQESYIRVWSLEGKALPSASQSGTLNFQPSSSRRLIGHSGPVYAVSFSPSTAPSDPIATSTASKYLLSSSADKSVRLWSLETWTCLVIYKGHDHPVWDVTWGPFGHYFVTGSQDKTARLWSTDQIAFLRMFVGHDMDVDTVCFHPNNAYVFTGSCDKIVRMWAITNGYPVRMFTGHAGNVTSLVCSPNGKLLASADDSGTIILWDLGPGRLLKRMRGHGKGGIWSLSWSVESTVLVSGGADGTVRVWDVTGSSDGGGQGKIVGEGGTGIKLDGSGQVQAGAGVVGGGGKKKGKDVVVTPDQISAFPTKKSPVYKVRFTRQNLVVAGGAYLP
ncbi:transcription initiation factor tfiid [Lasallia pustulata]|uniref:Transcription initiation factor tfiid n=1 Tax=Lasallia pustulata TaxID=136370 RepID=A0A1W5CUR4_9LECA|nr:transcription initiation factor tfiid [Lasallia pustulata]